MTTDDRIQDALRSPQPVAMLRVMVEELAREGITKANIQSLLEDFLVQQRERPQYREADEDTILDVLDALSGWCHSTAELLPEVK